MYGVVGLGLTATDAISAAAAAALEIRVQGSGFRVEDLGFRV